MGKTTEDQDFPKKPLLHFWHLERYACNWVLFLLLLLLLLFCFKVPAPGIWWSYSIVFLPLFLQFPAPHFLKKRLSYQSQGEWQRENIGMRNTLSSYIGHCRRTVLCMYLGPASVSRPIDTHISHVPACGSLGWRIVLALQTGCPLCPQLLASGSLALQRVSTAARGSRGPVTQWLHLDLPRRMDWNLSLCDKHWAAVDRYFLYKCNLLCHY